MTGIKVNFVLDLDVVEKGKEHFNLIIIMIVFHLKGVVVVVVIGTLVESEIIIDCLKNASECISNNNIKSQN